MLYGNGQPQCDDNSYLAHALALSEFEFPSYTRQAFVNGETPMHSIGPGLLALPFVALGNVADRVLQADPAPVRNYDTVRQQWATYGFFIASVFYFWLACALLFESARCVTTDRAASWSVILLILLQGAALYAFRRPIFSHVYELLLQSAMLWLLVRWHANGWRGPETIRGALIVGALSGLICLVRYNNAPIAAGWLLIFFWLGRSDKKIAWKHGVIAVAMVLLLVGAFKLVPTLLQGREKYAVAMDSFFRPIDPGYIVQRLLHILMGLDWGLVFTAPFLLIGLYFFIRANDSIHLALRWLLPFVAVNLYLVVMQGYHAAFYGYRLLLFSLLPLLVLAFARFLDRQFASRRQAPLVALGFLAILPATSMLFFEGNATTLTLQFQRHDYPGYSFTDWDNQSYQLEVWQTLAKPKDAALVVAKGGPAYIAFQVADLSGKRDRLPFELQVRYTGVGAKLFGQTLFIWLLPWILLWIWLRFVQGPPAPLVLGVPSPT